mmetsp:Transcript_16307/g.20497  ORF Transcript_16307/g.20497 Transcript_16307/m.20497 type:complete len:369 (-) Transcript_16307:344-1450(-)
MPSRKVHDSSSIAERLPNSQKRKINNIMQFLKRLRDFLWKCSGEYLWRYIFRRIVKQLVHWITGKPEIHRLCLGSDGNKTTLTINVAKSLLQSKQLGKLPSLIFSNKSFDARSMVDQILHKKHIYSADPIVRVNLKDALESISTVNALIEELATLRKEAFDTANPEHEALLEDFWNAMRPGVRRQHGRITSEWGEVGFQGKDPATDFRGMGILALQHLVHFAQRRPKDARSVLTISAHPVKYFPFAATGVNVTSFVCELLERRLLDVRLYKLTTGSQSMEFGTYDEFYKSEGPGVTDALTMQKMLGCIGDFYNDLYVEFGEFWEASNPKNTLDFPKIYGVFKTRVEERLEREWKGHNPSKLLESKGNK